MPTVKVKVRGVIRDQNRIFLCKLEKLGFYCLPGGTLESGETRKECLVRELYEELGVHAIIGELVYIQEFVIERSTTIDFWYEITNSADFFNVDISQTSHGFELSDAGFYALEEIIDPIKPDNLTQILNLV